MNSMGIPGFKMLLEVWVGQQRNRPVCSCERRCFAWDRIYIIVGGALWAHFTNNAQHGASRSPKTGC